MPSFAQNPHEPADALEDRPRRRPRSPSSPCSSSCCGSPPRRPTRSLVLGLDPADAGKVTAALDEQGIGYELRANGTTVAVEKAQVGAGADRARRRRRLGRQRPQAGLRALRRAEARRLRLPAEGHLPARAGGRDRPHGPAGRRRHAAPRCSSCSPRTRCSPTRRRRPPRPSCSRATPAALEPGAVRGIAQLTASSVKGLKTENVTITDGSGQLLWPQGDGAGGGGGAAAASRPRRRATSASSRPASTRCSRRRSGPARRACRSRPTSTSTRRRAQQLTIDGKAGPAKQTTETEKLKGGSATARRRARAPAGNIPHYSAGAARRRRGQLELQAQDETVENDVPKTVDEDRRRAGRGQQPPGRARGRQERPGRRLRRDPERGQGRRRHRHEARRRLPGLAARVRQGARRAEGRARCPSTHARPAEVGRPRPGDAAVHVLHEPRSSSAARARRSPPRAG